MGDAVELQSQLSKRDQEIAALNDKIKALFNELESVQTSKFGLQREKEQLIVEITSLRKQLVSLKAKGEHCFSSLELCSPVLGV